MIENNQLNIYFFLQAAHCYRRLCPILSAKGICPMTDRCKYQNSKYTAAFTILAPKVSDGKTVVSWEVCRARTLQFPVQDPKKGRPSGWPSEWPCCAGMAVFQLWWVRMTYQNGQLYDLYQMTYTRLPPPTRLSVTRHFRHVRTWQTDGGRCLAQWFTGYLKHSVLFQSHRLLLNKHI